MSAEISASWFPPSAQGVLLDTDANPAHIGGIVTMGQGRLWMRVNVGTRPQRFTLSVDGHDPFTFTVTPDMTRVVLSEGSRLSRMDRPRMEASFHYDHPFHPSGALTPADILDPFGVVSTIPAVYGTGGRQVGASTAVAPGPVGPATPMGTGIAPSPASTATPPSSPVPGLAPERAAGPSWGTTLLLGGLIGGAAVAATLYLTRKDRR